MFELSESVCPLFVAAGECGNVDHIGSGVLVDIHGQWFLLTAAHVTDHPGNILLPGRQGLTPVDGYFSHLAVPKGRTRNLDTLDIAYFRLNEAMHSVLEERVRPIRRDGALLFETKMEGDLYTFCGYPYRRTRKRQDTFWVERFTYTGSAIEPRVYDKLGYDPTLHIVIQFDRKRSYSSAGERIVPPLPHGMSGGAIFAHRKDAAIARDLAGERLVGIAHTFHADRRCMVGTGLGVFLSCIVKNNPHLQAKMSTAGTLMIVGVVWYQKEDWSQLKFECEDGAQLHESWDQWRDAAQGGVDYMLSQGRLAMPVVISAAEIAEFCALNRMRNVGRTRIQLANRKLADSIRETPLGGA